MNLMIGDAIPKDAVLVGDGRDPAGWGGCLFRLKDGTVVEACGYDAPMAARILSVAPFA